MSIMNELSTKQLRINQGNFKIIHLDLEMIEQI
jgi:hypothetical protein